MKMGNKTLQTHNIYLTLKETQKLICNICGKSLKKEWEQYMFWYNTRFFPDGIHHRYQINISIDHIIPRSKGGGPKHISNIKNLALTHKTCNIEKGDSLFVAGLNKKIMDSPKYFTQNDLHAMRKQIDACQQALDSSKQTSEQTPQNTSLYDMAHFQADIKLKEAKMWVGKMLEGLGSELPAQFQDKA